MSKIGQNTGKSMNRNNVASKLSVSARCACRKAEAFRGNQLYWNEIYQEFKRADRSTDAR